MDHTPAARAAVLGEPLRIYGYALAGAVLCPASDRDQALRAWRELPADVAVVVLTPAAAGWLAGHLAERPGVLPAVLPGEAPKAGAGSQAVPR